MNNTEFLGGIKLPRNLKAEIFPDLIKITLNSIAVRESMLNDSSAFEGWMFCIRSIYKRCLIQLNWEFPTYSEIESTKQNQILHYHRFLLRVYWCVNNYDWFSINPMVENEIQNFVFDFNDIKINFPKSASKNKKEREACDKVNKGEAILETKIYQRLNELVPGSANHQLPVGLFHDRVSTNNALTPRQGSQIDIWQIKGNTFRVFELKDKTNISVSIITELMYYSNIFYCVFISKCIKYPTEAYNLKPNKVFRSFDLIINALNRNFIKNIEAVLLAEKLHPIIERNIDFILEDINNNTAKIEFNYNKLTDYI